MRKLLIVLFAALLLASCVDGTVYYTYQSIEQEAWDKGDTLRFFVPRQKASGTFNEVVGLRLNSKYDKQRLALVVRQDILPLASDSDSIAPQPQRYVDTLRLQVYDSKGNINGSGVNNYQFDKTFRKVNLREGDSLVIAVYHIMHNPWLEGVKDVGLIISSKEEKESLASEILHLF